MWGSFCRPSESCCRDSVEILESILGTFRTFSGKLPIIGKFSQSFCQNCSDCSQNDDHTSVVLWGSFCRASDVSGRPQIKFGENFVYFRTLSENCRKLTTFRKIFVKTQRNCSQKDNHESVVMWRSFCKPTDHRCHCDGFWLNLRKIFGNVSGNSRKMPFFSKNCTKFRQNSIKLFLKRLSLVRCNVGKCW